MMSKLDEVARAICDVQQLIYREPEDRADKFSEETARKFARAAIEALMQPSEAMMEAGRRVTAEALEIDGVNIPRAIQPGLVYGILKKGIAAAMEDDS